MKGMQRKKPEVALSNTGRSERVGSYACQIWQESRDGKQVGEYCVAAKGAIPGGDELVAASHKAAAVVADIMSAAPQMAAQMSPQFAAYAKMDGFPVSVRYQNDDGKHTTEETVTAIERQPLSADKFEIPKGFKETKMGEDGPNE